VNDKRLDGRVAWVTGASSGNGRAIALRYAAEGARVVCADIDPTPAKNGFDTPIATHDAITAAGGEAVFARCDVTSSDDITGAVAACVERFGRVDICVANAGIAPAVHDLVDERWSDYARVVDVNQHGVWRTCRAAATQMISQHGGGRIIVVSSIGGLVGITAGADYNMTKHAVMGLVRTLAHQVASYGVTVNAINPGYVRTAMNAELFADPDRLAVVAAKTPLRRLGAPEDVAGAAFFLASDDAAWVTGIALPVDGGYTAV
jgi:NAD(P)-dependent dehydrogenase (short-subunit alcohol dehydrogenase family)